MTPRQKALKKYYEKNEERLKEYRKEYYEKNKNRHLEICRRNYQERYSEQRKNKHRQDPRLSLLRAAQQRAKRKEIEFNLLIEDIILPEFCPVLGLKLEVSNIRAAPNSPTLDRFDPKIGYTRENTRVISWRANDLKKDASIEELKAIIAYMEKS